MIRRFLFITLSSALCVSLCSASEPVLQGDTVLVQERKLSAMPELKTTVSLTDTGNSLETISARAANFYAGSSGARSFNDTFALRGLTNTPVFGDPAVTFYLNEIPLGGTFTSPSFLAGIATAELHRGPGQNTRYSQAGSAGVVQLLTSESGPHPAAQLSMTAGSYSSRTASLAASSPHGGQFDVVAAGQYAARDGYIFNDRLGRDVDRRKSTEGLACVNFRPAGTVQISLVAQAARARDGEHPLVPLNGPMFTSSRSEIGETSLDTFNAGLTAAVSTTWGRLSATSSINDWQLGPYRSLLSFGPSELANDVRLSRRTWHEALKLASNHTSALQWQTELYFADETTDGEFKRTFGPFVFENSSYTIDGRTFVACGEANLRLRPALALTAGFRLQETKKQIDRADKTPADQSYRLTNKSAAALPKLELTYSLDPNTRLFVSVGAGYKPGGFSAFTGNRTLATFGPERSTAWEAGVTNTALDKTLSATLRAFWYDLRGYQIERSFATGTTTDDYLVVNAPKARSTGFELELIWRPLAGLSLSFDYGYTHARLLEFKDTYSAQNYDGKLVPFVPQYDLALRVEYRNPSGWFGQLKHETNGRTYYTEAEETAFAQRAYSILGARLGFIFGRWSVAAYGENLLDERYYSSISAGTGHGTPGSPRTVGIEARCEF